MKQHLETGIEMNSETSPERRLHPLSLGFGLLALLRHLLVPALVLYFASNDRWQSALMLGLFGFAALASVVRYFAYRYTLAPNELVIRTGLVARRERRIPYGKIQNLDVSKNIFHRLLGVANVTIQTAGGAAPEATMQVLSNHRVDEIRQRQIWHKRERDRPAAGGEVGALEIGERSQGAPGSEPIPSLADEREPGSETLLTLPVREVLLLGLISNRGLAGLAALVGFLFQFDDFVPEFEERLESVFESWLPGLEASLELTSGLLLILAIFLLLKLLSVVLIFLSFSGFSLTRTGRELRVELGLLTKKISTIPAGRIQILRLERTPLRKLLRRTSIRIATAGGIAGEAASSREWLAPIVGTQQAEAIVHSTQEALLPPSQFREVSPRACARLRRQGLLFSLGAALLVGFVSPIASLVALPVFASLSWHRAATLARKLGYALSSTNIAFRTGWLTTRVTVVPLHKIQTLSRRQSPFDRRWQMSNLRIDTAGQGLGMALSHLSEDQVDDLSETLRRQVNQRVFGWT